MTVRASMSDLIALVRKKISDPSGTSQQFSDAEIQNALDATRDDIRYEALKIAPSIVNAASTNNIASTIYADYYSAFQYWEADYVLQGNDSVNRAWKVLTPVAVNLIVGHFQFELTPFVSGTVPGQWPPVFATGKVYDPFWAAADLLEAWGASLSCAYDFTSDGQSFKRSQLMQSKLEMAKYYRYQAKPRVAKMIRGDVAAPIGAKELLLLNGDEVVRNV